MRAIAAGLTDVGMERVQNEDRFILLPEFNVFVVADGMGGHQSGEVASRMAVSTVAGYFRRQEEPTKATPERLRCALTDANAKIHARADDSRSHRGMGTTAVAAAYAPDEKKITVAHAGDSRCYRVRGESIVQLTRDHSLIADALLERPELSESDLSYLPRNVITRALGIAATVEVDVRSEPVEVGDVYVLCTDGLHGFVSDKEIVAALRQYGTLTETCARLVNQANKNGGKDNITIVLVRIEADDQPWSLRSPSPLPPNSRPPPASMLSSTVGSEAWNSRDLKSRPH